MEQVSPDTSTDFDLDLTDQARAKIAEALNSQEGKDALRVEAHANGTAEFQYAMKLIDGGQVSDEDLTVELGDFRVVVDPGSAQNLHGATIDYEDRIVRSGFKFENPNKPEVPSIGAGPREDLTGPVAERIQALLDSEINPAVAAHGGMISLAAVKDNKVFLSFGGGCHGCGMVDVTLKQGVEARIREVIPEIEEVLDTTDHSTGENPYYS